MSTLVLIFLTFLAAVICGAVLLIKMGGWLPILAAIVIIIHYFFSTSILVMSVALDNLEKRKVKKGEAQKYERMGN